MLIMSTDDASVDPSPLDTDADVDADRPVRGSRATRRTGESHATERQTAAYWSMQRTMTDLST
jgi:hypothetical protein